MGIDEHFTSVNQSGREPICCGHQYVWLDTEDLPKTKGGFHSSQDSGWTFWCSWMGRVVPMIYSRGLCQHLREFQPLILDSWVGRGVVNSKDIVHLIK